MSAAVKVRAALISMPQTYLPRDMMPLKALQQMAGDVIGDSGRLLPGGVLVNELNRRQHVLDVGADFTHRNPVRLVENTVCKLGIAISIVLTFDGTHPKTIGNLTGGKSRAGLNQTRRESKTGKHGTVEILTLQEIHPAGIYWCVLGHVVWRWWLREIGESRGDHFDIATALRTEFNGAAHSLRLADPALGLSRRHKAFGRLFPGCRW